MRRTDRGASWKCFLYINNNFCVSLRERTWKATQLKIGDEIACNDLIEKEKFFWKKVYGKESWEKEKDYSTC